MGPFDFISDSERELTERSHIVKLCSFGSKIEQKKNKLKQILKRHKLTLF